MKKEGRVEVFRVKSSPSSKGPTLISTNYKEVDNGKLFKEWHPVKSSTTKPPTWPNYLTEFSMSEWGIELTPEAAWAKFISRIERDIEDYQRRGAYLERMLRLAKLRSAKK